MYEGFDKMVMDMEIFHINTMCMLINCGFIIQNVKFFYGSVVMDLLNF